MSTTKARPYLVPDGNLCRRQNVIAEAISHPALHMRYSISWHMQMHAHLPCLVVSMTIYGLPNYEERISTLYTYYYNNRSPSEKTKIFPNVDTLMCEICATRSIHAYTTYMCIYVLTICQMHTTREHTEFP